jgi:hypothetical protein
MSASARRAAASSLSMRSEESCRLPSNTMKMTADRTPPCLGLHRLAHFVIMHGMELVGVSTVMAFVVLGCGGSTSGSGATGSGGATGTGGSLAAGGGAGVGGGSGGAGASTGTGGTTTAGGTTGVDGSGGTSAGGTGGVSPGNASIEFTVTGGPFCHHGCDGPPAIAVADSTGHGLELASNCYTACKSCSISGCPPGPCYQDGVLTGAKLDWDGSYLATSTCGPGTSCLEPAVAPAGKYTATFCATPGKLTGPDGGFQQCVTSGPPKCGSVEFDLPSSVVVKGTVGP